MDEDPDHQHIVDMVEYRMKLRMDIRNQLIAKGIDVQAIQKRFQAEQELYRMMDILNSNVDDTSDPHTQVVIHFGAI